jgi:hypothetical protein
MGAIFDAGECKFCEPDFPTLPEMLQPNFFPRTVSVLAANVVVGQGIFEVTAVLHSL